jgi:hypothetical protein
MAIEPKEQPVNKMHFTFSDTIAGYITSVSDDRSSFRLKTVDGR